MGRKVIAVVVVLIIIAAVILGLTSSNNNNTVNTNNSTSNSSNSANQVPASTSSVSIQNMLFTPAQITVKKGTKVTWTNNDNVAHTVTADSGNGPNSSDIQPGSIYSYTFNTAGSFQYHCSIHPEMHGTVVVQ